MNLKVGDKFEMVWPFHLLKYSMGSSFGLSVEDCWVSGCSCHYEQYSEYEGERFLNANGEGVICYEVLSIAEMPKPYQDRVVFKRTLIDPDGEGYGRAKVETKTINSFMKDVNSATPFKADYEVED